MSFSFHFFAYSCFFKVSAHVTFAPYEPWSCGCGLFVNCPTTSHLVISALQTQRFILLWLSHSVAINSPRPYIFFSFSMFCQYLCYKCIWQMGTKQICAKWMITSFIVMQYIQGLLSWRPIIITNSMTVPNFIFLLPKSFIEICSFHQSMQDSIWF